MIDNMHRYINKYFSELLEHHKQIFSVYNRVLPSRVNYLSSSNQVFQLINLVSQVEKDFNDKFIKLSQMDIMQLEKTLFSLSNDEDTLEQLFNGFKNKYSNFTIAKHIKIKFFEYVREEFKFKKNNLRLILNTKLSYLDYYIYQKMYHSEQVKSLFKADEMNKEGSILEFLPNIVAHNHTCNIMRIETN